MLFEAGSEVCWSFFIEKIILKKLDWKNVMKLTKTKKKWLLLDFLILCIGVFLDQITKFWAVQTLKDQPAIELIPKILELRYLENTGAAFGMLQNQKYFFVLIAVVIIAVILFVLFAIPTSKRYHLLQYILVFIAAGAVGNLIDRLRLNYVVDFIYISYINFPIFNVADIYVTVSTFLLIFALLFVYSEADLDFLTFKARKIREL